MIHRVYQREKDRFMILAGTFMHCFSIVFQRADMISYLKKTACIMFYVEGFLASIPSGHRTVTVFLTFDASRPTAFNMFKLPKDRYALMQAVIYPLYIQSLWVSLGHAQRQSYLDKSTCCK